MLLGSAVAAQAHAVLERTSPLPGSVLKTAPPQVTLTFGEDVGVSSDDVQVFDDQLHRVDTGGAGHITAHGDTVGVHLKAGLHHGTYTVTWRVISADSHPVAGGFTFSIGAPSKVAGPVTGLGGGSRAVGLLLGGSRLVGYLGLVTGPGVLVFLLLLWPGGRADRRAQQIVAGGLTASIVAAAGLFLFEAPYAQGLSLAKGLSGSSLSLVASSHYGKVVMARLALLVILAAITPALLRADDAATAFAVVILPALPVTWAIAGHGGTGSYAWLASASETIHVAAITVWLGGLVVLVTRLLPTAPRAVTLAVLPRFSAIALGCIGAIVVTGTYQELRETGVSLTALTTTTYGKLLLAKIGGVIAIIGLGALARWLLRGVTPRALAGQPEETLAARHDVVRTRLRASVTVEVLIGLAVLVFTSILVNTVPAKDAVGATAKATVTGAGLQLDVVVTPARRGPASIDVTVLTAAGRPQHLVTVTGSLSLPARAIGSLPLTFSAPGGTDHVTATTDFPVTGSWRLSLDVQTSPIDATTYATTFTVH